MTRIAVNLPDDVAADLDELVRQGRFSDKDSALVEGARLLAQQQRRSRDYEAALAKLDPEVERAQANAFLSAENEWPEY